MRRLPFPPAYIGALLVVAAIVVVTGCGSTSKSGSDVGSTSDRSATLQDQTADNAMANPHPADTQAKIECLYKNGAEKAGTLAPALPAIIYARFYVGRSQNGWSIYVLANISVFSTVQDAKKGLERSLQPTDTSNDVPGFDPQWGIHVVSNTLVNYAVNSDPTQPIVPPYATLSDAIDNCASVVAS